MRMAAISKRLLRFRPYSHSHPRSHPHALRHLSSSSVPSDDPQSEHVPESDSATQSQSSFSSYFNEVKASLQREPPPQNRHQAPRKPLSFSNRTPPRSPPPSRAASLEEIRRNLSEFRLRSAAPPPSSSSSQHISLQELYKKNVMSRADGSAPSSDSPTGKQPVGPGAGGIHSYDTIRESFRRLKATPPAARGPNAYGGKPIDPLSLSRFKESLKLKPDANADLDSTMVVGGSDRLPPSFYGKERSGRWESLYGYPDLGKKLKMLRPENRKGQWFSLQELSDRLAKLREIEDKKSQAELGVSVNDIRDSLLKCSTSKDGKASPATMQRLPILGHLGGTPSFMLSPPKEHLVEKYFHPDNMSSAEKLKLELKKVRDEFKISESDCGSARVQVAQLTTKITHLSTVVHKKDKHSRRGLQAMVQRRKKLLKYLRRTDWDSYYLVLSKLGLRDNPDIKA